MLSLRGMAGVGYPPRAGQSEARSEMMRPARLAFYFRARRRNHSSAEKVPKARHGRQDAHYGLSVAAGRLSRFEMQADAYLAALQESDENTEVGAVALKGGSVRIIARIARRCAILASQRNLHQKAQFVALSLECVGLPARIRKARDKLFVGFRL